MRKSLGILVIIFLLVAVLRLTSFTYGFYANIIVNNPNSHSLSVNSKYLAIEYLDGTSVMNFDGDYLFPGNSAEKLFTIKNIGTASTTYNILIDSVINEFERTQDLRYVLYINEEEVTSGAINNNSVQYLYTNREISVGASDSIRFVFEYATTDEIQNVDMNKTISFRFNVDSDLIDSINSSSNINILANKNINNYRIYGNSIQDGTPFIDAPVEIKSLGNLVTDETSEHFGKYEIPIKVYGKNLINDTKYVNPGWLAKIENFNDYYFVKTETNTTGIAWSIKEKFQVGDVISFQAKINFVSNASNEFTDSVTLRIWNNTKSKWIHEGRNGNHANFSNVTCATTKLNEDIELKLENVKLTSDKYSPGDEIQFRVTRGMGANEKNEITFKVYKNTIMVTNTPELGKYVFYKEPINLNIFLDEPLRKVGNKADYIDFKKQSVIRTVRNISLNISDMNNSEDYPGWSDVSQVLMDYPSVNNTLFSASNGVMTNVFAANSQRVYINTLSNMKILFFYSTGLTQSQYKSNYSNLNFNVQYLINEEEIEKIKIPMIKTEDDFNVIFINTDIVPSNVYFEYFD